MRLLVAGASGRTGRILTRLAIERGHHVTALVRGGSRPLESHERLAVVVGDVLVPETLSAAVADQDAIVSLVAPRPRRDGRVYVDGTRNMADAAVRAGVRRFVIVSAEGAGVDPAVLPLGYRLVLRIPVVARLYPDIARMDRDLIARDDLCWTIVAPPVLTNGGLTGEYRVRTDGTVPRGLRLSRADLAQFLLDALEDDAYPKQRVSVAR